MFSRIKKTVVYRRYFNQCEKALMVAHRAGSSIGGGSNSGRSKSTTNALMISNKIKNVTALQPFFISKALLKPTNEVDGVEKIPVITDADVPEADQELQTMGFGKVSVNQYGLHPSLHSCCHF